MPENCIAPKSEHSNTTHPEEGPPEMTETVLPIKTNEQSFPKLAMFPITLKVIPLSLLSILYIPLH